MYVPEQKIWKWNTGWGTQTKCKHCFQMEALSKKINILITSQFFKNKHEWSDILLKNIMLEEQVYSNS